MSPDPQLCPACRSAVWGIEISEVYDGVLFWACPSCGWARGRNFGIPARDQRAADEAAKWTASRR